MQDSRQRVICAQAQDEASGDETYDEVLNQIMSLSDERRGAVAVRIAARLLEFAAFELAGKIESGQVGAIIDCAAELNGQGNVGQSRSTAPSPAPKQTFH